MSARFSCRRCSLFFNSIKERDKHVEFIHRLEIQLAYKNGKYLKIYLNLDDGSERIENIQRLENNSFQCIICHKEYKWASDMKKHARTCRRTNSTSDITMLESIRFQPDETNSIFIQRNGVFFTIASYLADFNIG